jgi:hypothetical protein
MIARALLLRMRGETRAVKAAANELLTLIPAYPLERDPS